MSVEVRTTPTRAAAGTTVNPAANTAQEQIAASQILDWVLQGYVFSGGAVLMDQTDVSTESGIDDVDVPLALITPSGTGTLVVPLRVRCTITDDGSGLTLLDLVYTRASSEIATAFAVSSGTTMPSQNHFTPNPMNASKCRLESAATSTEILLADSVTIAHSHMMDAGLTTGKIQLSEVFDYSFLSNPVILTEGAALFLYLSCASGAGKFVGTFTWAELPAGVYLP